MTAREGGPEPAPLVPQEMCDAPRRGFSDGGNRSGARLGISTGLPRRELLMCILAWSHTEPIPPPALWHRCLSSSFGRWGIRGVCPQEGARPHLPALENHPPLGLPLHCHQIPPLFPGREPPALLQWLSCTCLPAPAVMDPGLPGCHLPNTPTLLGSHCEWHRLGMVLPDLQPQKPWGDAALCVAVPRLGTEDTERGQGRDRAVPLPCIARPGSQALPVLHFPPAAPITARC